MARLSVPWYCRADRDTRRSGQNINGSGAVVYTTYQVKLSEPDPELEARTRPPGSGAMHLEPAVVPHKAHQLLAVSARPGPEAPAALVSW